MDMLNQSSKQQENGLEICKGIVTLATLKASKAIWQTKHALMDSRTLSLKPSISVKAVADEEKAECVGNDYPLVTIDNEYFGLAR
jgi:hypothetical protein